MEKTYKVNDLLLGESVLAEVGEEDLNFLDRAAIQVGERLENLSDFFGRDLVVDLKELFNLFRLGHHIDVQEDGHFKDQLHGSDIVNLLLSFQVIEEVLELTSGLS